jgi:uncharacterized membrane protein
LSEAERETIGLAEVNALRRAGVIPADKYLDAVCRCRDASFWTRWALRALLALGVSHLLAGIVFFFAYNWDDLSAFAKFAVLQGGILISVVGALIVRLDRVTGQTLLIAASVLVGTLLAVIGQVYQTGADAYETFAVWALLIFPWVIASQSAAHWLVWLVVAYAAFGLYADQVLIPLEWVSEAGTKSLLAVATIIFLALREIAALAGAGWLERRWTRLLLVFVGLLIVFWSAVGYVIDWEKDPLTTMTFIGMVLALAYVYGRLLQDYAALAIITGFVALYLMAAGGRLIHEVIGFDPDYTAKLLFALTVLVAWCAALTADDAAPTDAKYRWCRCLSWIGSAPTSVSTSIAPTRR